MNKKFILTTLVLIVVAMISWYFLKDRSKESETIKIVTSFPMRGISIGTNMVDGIKLALDEVNYKVGDFTIELVIEDDGSPQGSWRADREKEIADRAVADKDVMAYIGTLNSGAAKISIPINNKANLVQISPANTWPGLTKPGFAPGEPGIFYPTGVRNYFRINPDDTAQGPAAAIWAKELGVRNVYVYDDGGAYGKGIANIFSAKAADIGLNVIGHKTLDKKVTDFKTELSSLKNANLDLIYYGGDLADIAPYLVKDIKKVLPGVKFMAPDALMEQGFIDLGGEGSEGAYLTVVGSSPKEFTGAGKKFYDDYVAKYGTQPESFSAFAYEATKVILYAIEKAGVKDRAKILEEVSKIRNYEGILGTWSFNADGDTTLRVVSGSLVKDKAFVFQKVLTDQ